MKHALLMLMPMALACGELPIDSVPAGPNAPELFEPLSPTARPFAVLRGSKQANTSLLLDGEEIMPRGPETVFRFELPLVEGPNIFSFSVKDAVDRESPTSAVLVAHDATAPQAVAVNAPRLSGRSDLPLTLQKPAGCRVRENGVTIDGDINADSVVRSLPLVLGDNDFRWACVDAVGNEGPVTRARITRVVLASLPFAFDVPATTSVTPLVVRGTCNVDMEVRLAGDTAVIAQDNSSSACVDGVFERSVPLVEGVNIISVEVGLIGELPFAASLRQTTVSFTP